MSEVLLYKSDPQPEVRKNAENAPDWPYKDEAAFLYRMAVLFKDRLLDPLHHLDRDRLPDPVIAFENLRNYNTLAAFRLTRSPEGLQNEIIMKELGVERPQDKPEPTFKVDWFKPERKRLGTSTLTKWECPECHLAVRIGIKGNPEIVHDPCSIKKGEKVLFVRADTLAQAMLGVSLDDENNQGTD